MLGTIREQKGDLIAWEAVKAGKSPYTPNKPLKWIREISELWNWSVGTIDPVNTTRDVSEITPNQQELQALAKRFPAPKEWLEGDEEPPF